jgi:hypothetical protein
MSAGSTGPRFTPLHQSKGMDMYTEFEEGMEEMDRDRETRGRLMETLIATAKSSTAKPNLRSTTKPTKTATLSPIPPVKPLSATISKQQSLRASTSEDDHTRKKQHISGDQPFSTGLSRPILVVRSSSAGSVPVNTGSLPEPYMQDADEIRMDHAVSCIESGDYTRARDLVRQFRKCLLSMLQWGRLFPLCQLIYLFICHCCNSSRKYLQPNGLLRHTFSSFNSSAKKETFKGL